MTITPELYAIIGVGVALAAVIIPASNRHNRDINGLREQMDRQGQQVNQDINELRQQVNQQGQQITQIAQGVGRLAGLLEGLRGRPMVEPVQGGN